ncbi:MAG: hypothetical protein AB7F64_00515 [Gammaproteobacteria bacterium]
MAAQGNSGIDIGQMLGGLGGLFSGSPSKGGSGGGAGGADMVSSMMSALMPMITGIAGSLMGSMGQQGVNLNSGQQAQVQSGVEGTAKGGLNAVAGLDLSKLLGGNSMQTMMGAFGGGAFQSANGAGGLGDILGSMMSGGSGGGSQMPMQLVQMVIQALSGIVSPMLGSVLGGGLDKQGSTNLSSNINFGDMFSQLDLSGIVNNFAQTMPKTGPQAAGPHQGHKQVAHLRLHHQAQKQQVLHRQNLISRKKKLICKRQI